MGCILVLAFGVFLIGVIVVGLAFSEGWKDITCFFDKRKKARESDD